MAQTIVEAVNNRKREHNRDERGDNDPNQTKEKFNQILEANNMGMNRPSSKNRVSSSKARAAIIARKARKTAGRVSNTTINFVDKAAEAAATSSVAKTAVNFRKLGIDNLISRWTNSFLRFLTGVSGRESGNYLDDPYNKNRYIDPYNNQKALENAINKNFSNGKVKQEKANNGNNASNKKRDFDPTAGKNLAEEANRRGPENKQPPAITENVEALEHLPEEMLQKLHPDVIRFLETFSNVLKENGLERAEPELARERDDRVLV